MVVLWTILAYIIVLLIRIALAKLSPRYFNFDFDAIHHFDAGASIICSGVALGFNPWFIVIGGCVVADDILGHWRAAHGKPEAGPLENLVEPIIVWFWAYLNKGK